ncbi:hypothetical protein RF11_14941 [Thelohanellus kitauei]|uniref:Uncharacterized protein n=1 Tax=Thelohanellus kitauei TaxID=669202 RepID=A0A0C2MTX6_THEKT|nr:hypothetical protein RF11_14941 [Thelohanellus kitauei]
MNSMLNNNLSLQILQTTPILPVQNYNPFNQFPQPRNTVLSFPSEYSKYLYIFPAQQQIVQNMGKSFVNRYLDIATLKSCQYPNHSNNEIVVPQQILTPKLPEPTYPEPQNFTIDPNPRRRSRKPERINKCLQKNDPNRKRVVTFSIDCRFEIDENNNFDVKTCKKICYNKIYLLKKKLQNKLNKEPRNIQTSTEDHRESVKIKTVKLDEKGIFPL